MKTLLSGLCFALVTFFVTSCQKVKDELTEFDIDYSTSLPVPANSYTADVPASFTTPEIPTESKSKFSAQKTASDRIDEIKMTRFNVSVSTGNLDALKSMEIFLRASGKDDIRIATVSQVPQGLTQVAAKLEDVNIKDYIFNDKIQFRVNLVMGGGSNTNQQFKMDQTMHVKAKLIN